MHNGVRFFSASGVLIGIVLLQESKRFDVRNWTGVLTVAATVMLFAWAISKETRLAAQSWIDMLD